MNIFPKPVLILVAAMSVMCATSAQAKPPASKVKPLAEESVRGVIFVVEGIGGFGGINATAEHALPKAGVQHEIRNFIWTHGKGKLFKDLQDYRYMQRKSEQLAEEVLEYKKAHPDRPVYMIGKSGGTGLVLAAAEHLPEGTIERIVLLSAAVAADYDLRPALRATRREIISFYSVHDQFILGWGTSQFGTIDRVYGPAAGLRGFVMPEGFGEEDKLLYGRLVQVSWRPDMILQGHIGNHIGSSMPAFVRKEVAPWLR
jgi:pimeloyl-ACP methyl ester carboxylesterase